MSESNSKPLDLLYCGDRLRIRGFYLSLLSIANRTKRPLRVHIFTMGVPERGNSGMALATDDGEFLSQMINKRLAGSSVLIYNVTDQYQATIKRGKNNKNQYSPYSMIRLFADDVLKDVDKVIYLDDDTMGVSDIQNFEKYDLTGKEMGVVDDWLAVRWGHKGYFNSGVLYLNLDQIRKTGLFHDALDMCCNKRMSMPDQTALNRLSHGRVILPRAFNEQRKIYPDTVIAHYPKRLFLHFHPVKPWQPERMQKLYKIHDFDKDYEEYILTFPFEKYGFSKPTLLTKK
ncbi:MAG: hypothetical protein LKJ88_03715 [Bacilli bacterium]|jgi:lipopolysaccharide biosynthesis glycosyltransferase|nr:hypothetical protein [Bacilli bacterium]